MHTGTFCSARTDQTALATAESNSDRAARGGGSLGGAVVADRHAVDALRLTPARHRRQRQRLAKVEDLVAAAVVLHQDLHQAGGLA